MSSLIIIKNGKGEKMSVEDCWTAFSKVSSRFIASYASYYHYRSNKWTPKYGNKYGVDWVLYQKGPTYYHAEYF